MPILVWTYILLLVHSLAQSIILHPSIAAYWLAFVSRIKAEILHLKISNRKSEEQLRLLRKELASAKTANVLALASARRLSEQVCAVHV